MRTTATALAHPNIAFIKYWGNQDHELHLPANGSISMNLEGLFTRTRVVFDPDLPRDSLLLDGKEADGAPLQRVSRFLDLVRVKAGMERYARVESENNFPTGSGIASSASAFAALALAASHAAGLHLAERELSRLARCGSGSASRSVPGGFVEWLAGGSDSDSYAFSFAPPEHWDVADCIAIVSLHHKETGSSEGHRLAETSPIQAARIANAPRRLELCRRAILERDFAAFSRVVELDSNLMHAVMMTSQPPLFYWEPATVSIIKAVRKWRDEGLPVCYTIDAGPNVHVICPGSFAEETGQRLMELPGVQRVIRASPGGPARLIFEQTESP